MYIKLLILFAFFCTVLGTGSHSSGGPVDPGHKNKCWNAEKKVAFGVGKSFTKNCVKTVCVSADTHRFETEVHDCSHPGSMSRCKLSKPDYDLPYPDCCPQWEC